MKEWDELMSAALEWLERTWNREIGGLFARYPCVGKN
jgi:hypothetical protein